MGGEGEAEPRYRMLETVREFGAEVLAASGEEQEVRAAHAAWTLALAEHGYAQIFGPQCESVFSRLDADYDNFRAALEWAEEGHAGELGLRLVRALVYFWVARGHLAEARRRTERVLAWADPVPTAARGGALYAAGWLARHRGETDAAEALQTEALEVARANGDRWTEAASLMELGAGRPGADRLPAGDAQIETARALFGGLEASDPATPFLVSSASTFMGQVAAARGEANLATAYLEEALAQQRALGFTWVLAATLRILGDVARDRGDHTRALAAYQESLQRAHENGDLFLLADALAGIAAVAASENAVRTGRAAVRRDRRPAAAARNGDRVVAAAAARSRPGPRQGGTPTRGVCRGSGRGGGAAPSGVGRRGTGGPEPRPPPPRSIRSRRWA